MNVLRSDCSIVDQVVEFSLVEIEWKEHSPVQTFESEAGAKGD